MAAKFAFCIVLATNLAAILEAPYTDGQPDAPPYVKAAPKALVGAINAVYANKSKTVAEMDAGLRKVVAGNPDVKVRNGVIIFACLIGARKKLLL